MSNESEFASIARLLKENSKNSIFLATQLLVESPPIVASKDESGKKVLYIYQDTHYHILDDDEIKTMLLNFLIRYSLSECWKSNRINEIIGYIRATDTFKEVKMNGNEDLICLNNGVFDLKSKTLLDFSSQHFTDTQINVDYVRPLNAERGYSMAADCFLDQCPVFSKFLHEVFNNDPVLIENALKLGGYLLDRTMKANMVFFFNGPGASGKTTLQEAYLMFFNQDQTSSLDLEALSKRDFDLETLLTSRVNIVSEQKRSYVDAEQLKLLSEGFIITIKRKYQANLTIRPTMKILVACNGMPNFSDTSTGIHRRLLIFNFNNQYKDQEVFDRIPNPAAKKMYVKDPLLLDAIKKEKSLIFNAFVAGLLRLRAKNYKFEWNEKLFKVLENYKIQNDTVAEFLTETYEIDDSNMENMPVIMILDQYRKWYNDNVQENGKVKLRTNEMTRRIQEVFDIEPSDQKSEYVDALNHSHMCSRFNLIKRVLSVNIPAGDIDTSTPWS